MKSKKKNIIVKEFVELNEKEKEAVMLASLALIFVATRLLYVKYIK